MSLDYMNFWYLIMAAFIGLGILAVALLGMLVAITARTAKEILILLHKLYWNS